MRIFVVCFTVGASPMSYITTTLDNYHGNKHGTLNLVLSIVVHTQRVIKINTTAEFHEGSKHRN